MGFPRQEYWSGLPCPPLGDLLNPGIEPASPLSPALAGGFFFLPLRHLEEMDSQRRNSDYASTKDIYELWLSSVKLRCVILQFRGLLFTPFLDLKEKKKKKGRANISSNSSYHWMTQSRLETVKVARLIPYGNMTGLVFLPFLCSTAVILRCFVIRTPLHFSWGLPKCYCYVHYIYWWASLVAQMVKNPPTKQETWVQSLGWEDPLAKGMDTHFSILAWIIPRTEELGGLQFTGVTDTYW